MSTHISKRIAGLGASSFDLYVRAQKLREQGFSVIQLVLGEPDFPTPDHIKQKAMEGLAKDLTHYTMPQGLPELREAVSEYEYRRTGVRFSPDHVVITPGAKPMILYALMAITNPGDEVLYPDPGYLTYPSLIHLAGGTPVPYSLDEENGFQPDFQDLTQKISSRTVAILLNSPHNPTGSILSRESIERILDLAREKDFYVISDEIYSRLVFEGEFVSVLEYWTPDGRILFIDGFSKAFAMTGWRLGYGVVPKDLVQPIVKLVTNTVSCAPSFVQYAGIEALLGPQDAVEKMRQTFARRRDLVLQEFRKTDLLSAHVPQGTFYVFPRYHRISQKSLDVAIHVLEHQHVSILPGSFFGPSGEFHLRLSFAASESDLREGIRRLVRGLEALAS